MQALRSKLERENFDSQPRRPGRARATAAIARPAGDSALLALSGESLSGRFRHWRGASGQRYIFSVYDPSSCPAYEHVVLILVAVDRDARHIIFAADTGALPDLALQRAREMIATLDCAVEFHVHLLASSRAERMATIDDLAASAHARRN